MSYINEMTIMGNLGSKPELRTSKTGKKSTLISIATKERWIDKHTLEPQGDKIWVRGELSIHSYTDNEGVQRQRVEVIARSLKLITTKNKPTEKNETVTLDSTDYVEDIGELSDE